METGLQLGQVHQWRYKLFYVAAFFLFDSENKVHAASLIHDDLPCMDDDPSRRGQPSSHTVYGVDIAILAGDALFPLGFRHIVSQTPSDLMPEPCLLRVIAEIARSVGFTGMAAGQFLDLEGGPNLVDFVQEKKFGEMAECSAVCGGLLGGAKDEEIRRLRRYGRAVGVLYPVVEDRVLSNLSEEYKAMTNGMEVMFNLLTTNDYTWTNSPEMLSVLKPPLMRLCARYLLQEKKRGKALDSVANFHLQNGAMVERINWMADRSEKGQHQSAGIMVNYVYRLENIEEYAHSYFSTGQIHSSDDILQYVKGVEA